MNFKLKWPNSCIFPGMGSWDVFFSLHPPWRRPWEEVRVNSSKQQLRQGSEPSRWVDYWEGCKRDLLPPPTPLGSPPPPPVNPISHTRHSLASLLLRREQQHLGISSSWWRLAKLLYSRDILDFENGQMGQTICTWAKKNKSKNYYLYIYI